MTSVMWLAMPVVSAATMRIETRKARFDNPVGVVLAHALGIGAVVAVDRDARVDRHEPEYVVTLDRVTAFGQFVLDLRDVVVDHQRVLRRGALPDVVHLVALGFGRGGTALFVGFARDMAGEDLLDRAQVDFLRGDQCVDFRAGADFEVFDQVGHRLVDGQREFPVLELAFELFAPHARMFGLFFAQVGLDLVAGLRRDHEVEPVGFGRLVLLGQDFDDVAVVELFADRDRPVVDLAPHARGTQRGVDVEREVQERSPFGQFPQVAVGREDEDLARLASKRCASECVVSSNSSRRRPSHISLVWAPWLTPL